MQRCSFLDLIRRADHIILEKIIHQDLISFLLGRKITPTHLVWWVAAEELDDTPESGGTFTRILPSRKQEKGRSQRDSHPFSLLVSLPEKSCLPSENACLCFLVTCEPHHGNASHCLVGTFLYLLSLSPSLPTPWISVLWFLPLALASRGGKRRLSTKPSFTDFALSSFLWLLLRLSWLPFQLLTFAFCFPLGLSSKLI